MSEVCLFKTATESRKSTLTQRASNVAPAEPSASTPADIYTVQDATQLLCYKLPVDLFSVYNSIDFTES